ncbi:hypothetical protein BT93_D1562 [Corymbia citriodora subsp. variegata]|nr:hypothetical protein BT93_D1562 [Corymbia citriodora subsp. variegata]
MEPVEDPQNVFSNGSYLANLAVSSNILRDSWRAVSEHQGSNPVTFIDNHTDYNIIAFVSSPDTTGDSVLLSGISDFQFQCSNAHPSFSINKAASSRFNSLRPEFPQLQEKVKTSFKPKASDSSAEQKRKEDYKPYIITGRRQNGSVASLFTLSLLDTLDPTKYEFILCITFGSPLLGDDDFQQALSHHRTWSSCFLHVVHKDDCVPRSFLGPPTSGQPSYKPFGPYLWCSESGCACFQAPDSVIELLLHKGPENDQESQTFDYKDVITCLEKITYAPPGRRHGSRKGKKGDGFSLGHEPDTYKAGVTAQVTAVGLCDSQQQNKGNSDLIENIVKHEQEVIKRQREEVHPAKKLEEMKVYLAYMEWYISRCRASGKGPGYYDSFKNAQEQRDNGADKYKTRRDNGADKYKTNLMGYWEKVVEDAVKKPQIPGAPLRNRWLFGGTNYRRIVEPVEIAEYYSSGQKEYIKQGRSEHFKLLEKWMEDHRKKKPPKQAGPSNSELKNVKSILTEDSCFWARVEEALRSCRVLVRGGSSNSSGRENLIEFEEYVMGLIKEYKVSPDIFLTKSSYMEWWRDYEKILGDSPDYKSPLVAFMRGELYKKYAEGSLKMNEEDHSMVNPPDSSNADLSSTEVPNISPSSFSLHFTPGFLLVSLLLSLLVLSLLVLSRFLHLSPFPFPFL